MKKTDEVSLRVQIVTALYDSFLSYSTARSLLESMMKLDFKIGDRRTAFMQLCFSYLAAWPVVPMILILWLKPFSLAPDLNAWLGADHPLVLFLLNGQISAMLTIFLSMFVIQWVLRKEYVLIFLIFYLQSRSEIHIHLSVSALLAVYFSRLCYLWWLSVDVAGQARQLWKSASIIQMCAWLLVAGCALTSLDHIQKNFLWVEAEIWSGRYGFLALLLLGYHVLNHSLLSLWGHFAYVKKTDPSDLPSYYSTSTWILRFNMSHHLQSLLRRKVSEQIALHQDHQEKLRELPDHLRQSHLQSVIGRELSWLKEASLRLTKI